MVRDTLDQLFGVYGLWGDDRWIDCQDIAGAAEVVEGRGRFAEDEPGGAGKACAVLHYDPRANRQ